MLKLLRAGFPSLMEFFFLAWFFVEESPSDTGSSKMLTPLNLDMVLFPASAEVIFLLWICWSFPRPFSTLTNHRPTDE